MQYRVNKMTGELMSLLRGVLQNMLDKVRYSLHQLD